MIFAAAADFAVTRDPLLPAVKFLLIIILRANILIKKPIYAAYSKNVLKNAITAEESIFFARFLTVHCRLTAHITKPSAR